MKYLNFIMLGKLIVLSHCIKIVVLWDMYSNVDLQIQKVDKSHVTFICSCNSPPYGNTVEFSVNNISVASITFLDEDEKCYIQRRTCNAYECACTDTQFNWTLLIPVDSSYSLTCQVRDLQEQHGRHLKLFKTLTLHGTDIIDETIHIEHIRIPNSNLTNRNTTTISDSEESTNRSIIIGTLVPVALLVFIIAFIFVWKYVKKRRQRNENPQTFYTDDVQSNQGDSPDCSVCSDVMELKDIPVKQDTPNVSARSYNTYGWISGDKKPETSDSRKETGPNKSYTEEFGTGNEDSERDCLMKDMERSNKQNISEFGTGNEDSERDCLMKDMERSNKQNISGTDEIMQRRSVGKRKIECRANSGVVVGLNKKAKQQHVETAANIPAQIASCIPDTKETTLVLNASNSSPTIDSFGTGNLTIATPPLNPILEFTTEPDDETIYQRCAPDKPL